MPSESHRSLARRGCLAVVLASILFSAKSVVIKLCFRHGIQPMPLMALRSLFSLPFYLVIGCLSLAGMGKGEAAPLRTREVLAVAGLGLLGFYVASIFDVMGLQFVSAGLERLILFTYPTWVVLLSALLLGKALGRKLWFPLALSYSGMLLSFGGEAAAGPGKGLFLGGALILASAVSYALFLVFQGGLMDRVGPQRLTAYAMLSASLAVFAHFALFHPVTTLVQPPTVYGLALVLSVFCSVIPAFLFAYGVKTVGTGPAAILSSVGPVATLFLGWWLLGEPAGFPQVAGMALVMAGGLKLGMGR